jgi:geranylgeranyl pyrophosphate synthase
VSEQPFSAEAYLNAVAPRVEAQLRGALERLGRTAPRRLAEAVAYALLGGGKRLRPALAVAAAEALGGGAPEGSLVMRFAAALEMIHTYSLVHDDLPCMDDDDLRRGRPTVHKAFDEATAVLVGDALQTMAFEHLLERPDARSAELARLLAGNATLMVEGQARDLEAETRHPSEEEIAVLMRSKTGALIAAAVAGGAVAATGSDHGLYRVGLALGLAFQIADDLLDLTASVVDLGKRVRKDAAQGKATLPGLVGQEEARRRAESYRDEALAALAPHGGPAEPLRALARFMVDRRK